MTPRKKLHNKWARELKQWFTDANIRSCERCHNSQPPLDIAHSRKRYDIKTRLQYFEAVLLCRACHLFVETGKHDRMLELVQQIINRRTI